MYEFQRSTYFQIFNPLNVFVFLVDNVLSNVYFYNIDRH